MAVRFVCSVDGCDKPKRSGGFCNKHYQRWYRHGDPLAGLPSPTTQYGEPARYMEAAIATESDECLIWPYSTAGKGYPVMLWRKKMSYVHRIVCERENGKPPALDSEAAHSCGNSRCINKRHLRWATHQANQLDKVMHGTATRGERHYLAKLDSAKVREIRALRGQMSQSDIGEKFGITQPTVSQIQLLARWGWMD